MSAKMNLSNPPQFDPARLVFKDRVHSSVFTDDGIFELEMNRLFKRTWLFALHDSEIPNPGDFKAFDLAKIPVIAVRNKDQSISMLVNRCRHRGATLCEKGVGNARNLTCWYHGWVYDLDGSLISDVGQGEKEDLGLTRLPRVDNYRGFVFTSFSAEGETLVEYLNEAREFIDVLLDYSPTGRIRINPKVVHKYKFRGNWKQLGMDGYHVHYVHASVVDIFSGRKNTTGSAVGALQIEDPWSDESSSRARGFPFGHAALDLRQQRLDNADSLVAAVEKGAGGQEFVDNMIEIHGKERAKEIIALHGDPHLGVFPNLQLIHDHLRVMVPISASETEIHMYPIFLEGVPAEFNTARLRNHEDFYGPASFGSPDDAAIFERVQEGLLAGVNPWMAVGRGMDRDWVETGNIQVGPISDEVTQRAQFAEWRRLMTD